MKKRLLPYLNFSLLVPFIGSFFSTITSCSDGRFDVSIYCSNDDSVYIDKTKALEKTFLSAKIKWNNKFRGIKTITIYSGDKLLIEGDNKDYKVNHQTGDLIIFEQKIIGDVKIEVVMAPIVTVDINTTRCKLGQAFAFRYDGESQMKFDYDTTISIIDSTKCFTPSSCIVEIGGLPIPQQSGWGFDYNTGKIHINSQLITSQILIKVELETDPSKNTLNIEQKDQVQFTDYEYEKTSGTRAIILPIKPDNFNILSDDEINCEIFHEKVISGGTKKLKPLKCVIDEKNNAILCYFSFVEEEKDTSMFVSQFSVSISITRKGQSICDNWISQDLYFVNAISTSPDMFQYTDLEKTSIGKFNTPLSEDISQKWEKSEVILIPKNVTQIDADVFSEAEGSTLPECILAKKRYLILDETFDGFTDNNGCNLQTISDGCFKQSSHIIGSLNFPKTLKLISNEAFAQSSISSINFETDSQLETIGYKAFWMCTNLCSGLKIPKSLQTLSSRAFEGCDLRYLEFEEGINLTEIGTRFNDDVGHTFENNVRLNGTLNIPSSVTTINESDFACTTTSADNFIQEIIVPSSVTNVSKNAFCDLNYLSVIDFSDWGNTIPKWDTNGNEEKDIFLGCKEKGKIIISVNMEDKTKDDLSALLEKEGVPIKNWTFEYKK